MPATAVIDPFYEETTVNLRCDVIEPMTMQGYERDPRSLGQARRGLPQVHRHRRLGAVRPGERILHLRQRHAGLEHERLRLRGRLGTGRLELRQDLRGGNKGHRPGVKGGYFPVPPVDAQQDIRTAMSMACEEMGLKFEVHHHEVATAGQGEINVAPNTLVKEGR
jgi:glutamine synthetase